MAAPTLAQIRGGIADNLSAVLTEWQVSAYMLSNPTPPSIHMFPEEVVFDQAMGRGMDTIRVTVQALAGLTTDRGAQERIDQLLVGSGGLSLKAAVESDRTLSGAVDDLRVVRASGYKVFNLDGRTAVLGCDWTVEVVADGV